MRGKIQLLHRWQVSCARCNHTLSHEADGIFDMRHQDEFEKVLWEKGWQWSPDGWLCPKCPEAHWKDVFSEKAKEALKS